MIAKQWNRFKRWMRYEPPFALTSTGWRLFNNEYKEKAKFRYFITNKVPKFFRPIKWKYEAITRWVRYRTIDRYHVVDTGLSPGWHEFEVKILHVSFNMLKDFVEVELASHYQAWHSEEYPYTWKEKLPFYFRFFYRKPSLGLKHLEWEVTLDDPSLPPQDQSVEQARNAREILALYKWWIARFSRTTENTLTYDDQGFEMGILDGEFDRTAVDYQAYRAARDEIEKIEEKWEQEDNEMLPRLIAIRKKIWT